MRPQGPQGLIPLEPLTGPSLRVPGQGPFLHTPPSLWWSAADGEPSVQRWGPSRQRKWPACPASTQTLGPSRKGWEGARPAPKGPSSQLWGSGCPDCKLVLSRANLQASVGHTRKADCRVTVLWPPCLLFDFLSGSLLPQRLFFNRFREEEFAVGRHLLAQQVVLTGTRLSKTTVADGLVAVAEPGGLPWSRLTLLASRRDS